MTVVPSPFSYNGFSDCFVRLKKGQLKLFQSKSNAEKRMQKVECQVKIIESFPVAFIYVGILFEAPFVKLKQE